MTATKHTRSRVIVEEDESNDETNENSSNASESVVNSDSNESEANDSNDEESGSENDPKKRTKNAGWADSMAKILKTNKPKGKKSIVLAKAKKLNEVVIKEKPKDPGFEVENEIKEEKPDPEVLTKDQDAENRKKKKEVMNFRVKPSILDKDRERTLSKIATRGVVQLFNAVRAQQRDIDNKLKEAGPLERKQSQVLKNIDKRAFLDVLMGGERSKSQLVDGPVKKELKSEVKNEKRTDSKWSVLRDDFMVESKMKDWDKEDPEEDKESSIENLSDDDSET